MAIIPQLIAQHAFLLYFICAFGALVYIWSALRARQESGQALYTVQRDWAANKGFRSWLIAGLFVLVAVGIFIVYAYVDPTLADEAPLYTPPPVPILTPTPTTNLTVATSEPISSAMTPLPTMASTSPAIPTSAPQPTLAPVTPDTPTPDTSAEPQILASAGVQIAQPAPGDRLWGLVEVRGTASIPDFNFYKFELQFPGSSDWVTVQMFDVPVAGGVLGYLDTSNLPTGEYRLRLVVVDVTHNFPPPFEISVVVEPPSPEDE